MYLSKIVAGLQDCNPDNPSAWQKYYRTWAGGLAAISYAGMQQYSNIGLKIEHKKFTVHNYISNIAMVFGFMAQSCKKGVTHYKPKKDSIRNEK